MLWVFVIYLCGLLSGAAIWSAIVARDEDVVRLGADEVIVKRPLADYVLIQVTPDIARQVINAWGKTDAQTGEARSIYENRLIRARRQADAVTPVPDKV